MRRRALLAAAAALAATSPLHAQTNWREFAVPAYTPPAFVDGLLHHWVVPQAQAFATEYGREDDAVADTADTADTAEPAEPADGAPPS